MGWQGETLRGGETEWMVDSGCPWAAKLPLLSEWQVRSSLPSFSPCICLVRWRRRWPVQSLKAKERMSPWSCEHCCEFRYILVKQSLFWFAELVVFEKYFGMSVWLLVGASACYAMQTIRPESYRWCRIMLLVIQWCCLGMRHPSKVPCTPQSNGQ